VEEKSVAIGCRSVLTGLCSARKLSGLGCRFLLRALYEVKAEIKANKGFCTALLTYILALSIITISKHRAFLTSFYDLGILNQALWTTLFEHKLFYETGDLSFNPRGSFFGTHFSPILFLLLPLYAIYPSCEILLILQTATLAIGAIPVHRMARERFGTNYATYISILYLIYPPLIAVNLNDFHLEALTSTLLLFAVYYLERKAWAKFFLFTILAMSTLEFVPVIVLFMAIYGVTLCFREGIEVRRKALRNLSLMVLIAIFWFILALKLKELFNPFTPAIPSSWHPALSEPVSVLQIFLNNLSSKLFYIMSFLIPLAFLPLLDLKPLIMTIPWFGASFTSTCELHYSVYYQYNSFVIPFVFIALIKGLERLKDANSRSIRRLLIVMFLFSILFGTYLLTSQGSPWMYRLPVPTERTQLLHNILSLIPSSASILTQNDIGPHLSSRSNLYVSIPASLFNNITVDYVLVDVNPPWIKWRPGFPGEVISPIEFVMKALESNEYGILASAKGILLLKKGHAGDPVLFVPYVAEYDYRNLIVANGRVVEDYTVGDKVIYRSADDKLGIFWYGPYVNLVPGLYELHLTLKVDGTPKPEDHILTLDVVALGGKVTIAKKDIYGIHIPFANHWFNVTMTFGLKAFGEDIEFRGFAHGKHNVSLYRITVRQMSGSPSSLVEFAFSAGDLQITENAVLYDNLIVHRGGAGTLWYGPYVNLPRGSYVATFWLRLDAPYDGDLIDIDVATHGGKSILAKATISSSNFTNVGVWTPFNLAFSLSEDVKDAEFRGVNVRKDAPISLLLIEIRPRVG